MTPALCWWMAATMLVSNGRKPVKSILPAFGVMTLCAKTFLPYSLSLSMALAGVEGLAVEGRRLDRVVEKVFDF